MPGDVAVVALGSGTAGFLQDGLAAGNKLCGSPGARGAGSPEAKSGSMILVGPGKMVQSVQVKVYRTSLEHFAVVYPQKKICRPLGFVNLRHTVVDRLHPTTTTATTTASTTASTTTTTTPAASRLAAAAGDGVVADVVPDGPRRAWAPWLPRQYQHLPGLVVRHRECDSPHTLAFLSESKNPKELDAWLSAFDPASKGSPSAAQTLPVLEEDEEQ